MHDIGCPNDGGKIHFLCDFFCRIFYRVCTNCLQEISCGVFAEQTQCFWREVLQNIFAEYLHGIFMVYFAEIVFCGAFLQDIRH